MSSTRLLAIAASALLLAGGATAADDRLAIIVHPSRRDSLRLEEIARIYLKQQRFWSNGNPIVAVNGEAGHPSRDHFTKRVFGERAPRLGLYWNRQYFRGVLPPATLASDAAVLRFVSLEPKAIGYIPAALVDDSVRVVLHIPPP